MTIVFNKMRKTLRSEKVKDYCTAQSLMVINTCTMLHSMYQKIVHE